MMEDSRSSASASIKHKKTESLTMDVPDSCCHTPNTFGTVNMEHTIDLRLSWSE